MKTSLECRLAIMAYEGLYLEAYADLVGVWTIGVGHTQARGKPIPVSGMTLSLSEAIEVFNRDVAACEAEIRRAIKIDLTQRQFDAIVSWQFNLGAIGAKDTTLTKRLNESRFDQAADELLRWDKAKVNGVKRPVKALTERRKAEREMFLNGVYGTSSIAFKQPGKKLVAVSRAELADDLAASLGDGSMTLATQGEQVIMAKSSASIADASDGLSGAELVPNPDSAVLPRYRPRQGETLTRNILRAVSDLLPPERRSDKVMLLAVRGYFENSLGKAGQNDRGLYDDAIFVIEPEQVHNFNANTDPSVQQPGIAQLKAPQAVRYVPGYHGYTSEFGHQAFRQNSPVVVLRDGLGERTDAGAKDFFWINLHRGGNTRTSSEGCQTVPPNQWSEFKPLIDGLLKQYGQKDFYYVLITEAERRSAAERASGFEVKQGDPPVTTMPSSTDPRSAEMAAIVAAVIQVLDSRRVGSVTPPLTPNSQDVAESMRRIEETLAAQGKLKPELTPVNAAMGQTLGTILDGKKTAGGTIGLLLSTLLPALVPIIPGLAPVAAAISAAAPIAIPILAALTGWGVLGKIDKWFEKRPPG